MKAETAAATARKQAARDKQLAPAKVATTRDATRDAKHTSADDLGAALELAGRAREVKRELQKRPSKGEKSWIGSGLASLALGPVGWLYAGAWREAVPASIAWVILALIAGNFLPTLLTVPVLLVALPASAIAGVTYALQHNRQGKRTRLFGKPVEPKQLKDDR